MISLQKSRQSTRYRTSSPTQLSQQQEQVGYVRALCSSICYSLLADDNLFLALYNIAGDMTLYRLQIRWSSPPMKSVGPNQQMPHSNMPNPPVINCLFLSTLTDCKPFAPNTNTSTTNFVTDANPKFSLPAQLTHLNFLSVLPDEPNKPSKPILVATFTHTPGPIASLNQGSQNPFSILCRWELDMTTKDSLHPIWETLAPNKKPKVNPAQVRGTA
jgi:hypothetical protein